MKYTATLMRGETYMLGNVVFRKNVPVEIDEETKAHLTENAIDNVTVQHNPDEKVAETRQKFQFVPIEEVFVSEREVAEVEVEVEDETGYDTDPKDDPEAEVDTEAKPEPKPKTAAPRIRKRARK